MTALLGDIVGANEGEAAGEVLVGAREGAALLGDCVGALVGDEIGDAMDAVPFAV